LSNHLSAEQREDLHFRVLRLLGDNPELSQRQMAAELDISLGRVNYCLRALAQKGLIKIANFGESRHKLGYVHVVTPKGLAKRAALTTRFLQRKLAEYDALKQEIAAIERELHEETRRQ